MGFIDDFNNKYSTGGLQHLTAANIRTEVGEVKFHSYLKFSVVRDPYTKSISQFFYMATRPDLRSFIGMKANDSFETYLDLIQMRAHVQWSPQRPFICDDDGELLIDRILRFENYERDVSNLCRDLGVRVQSIPHLNESVKMKSSELLTPAAILKINEIYEVDFKYFGYEMK
jgi:hypothetical protein